MSMHLFVPISDRYLLALDYQTDQSNIPTSRIYSNSHPPNTATAPVAIASEPSTTPRRPAALFPEVLAPFVPVAEPEHRLPFLLVSISTLGIPPSIGTDKAPFEAVLNCVQVNASMTAMLFPQPEEVWGMFMLFPAPEAPRLVRTDKRGPLAIRRSLAERDVRVIWSVSGVRGGEREETYLGCVEA
jgi:hypothetical protein